MHGITCAPIVTFLSCHHARDQTPYATRCYTTYGKLVLPLRACVVERQRLLFTALQP